MRKFIFITLAIIVCCGSCAEFLDLKPDASIKNPETLEDLSALLNNLSRTSMGNYSGLVESGTDDYEIEPSFYQTRTYYLQSLYKWDVEAQSSNEGVGHSWTSLYQTVLYANIVLEYLDKISGGDQDFRYRIQGDALFLRSYRFFQLLQTYAPAYLTGDVDSPYGIPLKLTSNVNVLTDRSSLKTCYLRIIDDLKKATELLPEHINSILRPNKAAAYGLLARVCHSIGDYEQALFYAQKCLILKSSLLDYNTVNVEQAFPFNPTNVEIIYHAGSGAISQLLASNRINVTQDLYSKYTDDDLRKKAFFYQKAPGRVGFKGFYTGGVSCYYAGITVSELQLIAAESSIRLGNINEGLHLLNSLLKNRYLKDSFVPKVAAGEFEALSIVLEERRKELPFRGIRWSDLRRLNRDPRFSKTIMRSYPNQDGLLDSVILPPNDKKYCYQIPQIVIDQTGISQNP